MSEPALRIRVERHYCHEAAELELPIGVTLIIGRNGAGKSAISVESQAVALFGRTVRGGSPGDAYFTRVEASGLVVQRHRAKKGATPVLAVEIGGKPVGFETATRAQEALEAHLGVDFAGWRRTHLFSAAGLAQFSEATDAERKRLLESLLGLGKFDGALSACRNDRSAAGTRRLARQNGLGVLRARHGDSLIDVHDAQEKLDALLSQPPLELDEAPDSGPLEAELRALEQEYEALEIDNQAAVTACVVTDAAAKRAKKAESDGVCQECGRAYDDHDPEALTATAEATFQAALAAQRQARAVQGTLKALAASMNEAKAALTTVLARRDAVARQLTAHEGEVTQARAQLAAFQAREAQADRDLEEAEIADEADAAELALLFHVEKVLGLKGARAMVLVDALAAVADEANRCLDELAPGLALSLTVDGTSVAFTVDDDRSKADKAIDQLSNEERHVGANTYEAASAGERCRMDVALLLGIASIAPRTGLPLVFDDVFGALDEDGIDAVARLLERVGQDRPVVVITQLDGLVSRMRGCAQVVEL